MNIPNKRRSIGVIGAGNMATAIIKGMIKNQMFKSQEIFVFDVDNQKLSALKRETGINAAHSNPEVVEKSSIVILAVKPVIYPIVLNEIKEKISSEHILISIAAGVSSHYVKQMIDDKCKVVRVMPNTPALVGEGMTALCKDSGLSEEERGVIMRILSTLGKVEEVEEKYINAVTAISGSSPAYAYMFIEALADGGVLMGLARDQAYRMAAQAVLGSAKMVLESGLHPGVLKDMVCSPGGTTIEAVYSLEQKGFRGALMEAVRNCALKGEKMDKDQ